MEGYTCYGAAAEFFDLCDPRGEAVQSGALPLEILLDGPGGTGKTRCGLELVNWLCTTYPGLRVGIIRKTRAGANDTWIPIYETYVLGHEHPAFEKPKVPSSRWAYRYPNGSMVVPLGMNNPTRLFSSEWHVLYVVEAIELTLEEWEQLHRGLRAPGGPYRLLFGDTNPGPKSHWLNQRFPDAPRTGDRYASTNVDGKVRFRTRHSDNPRADREYLARLRMMGGTRRLRLYDGEWVASEGLVWKTYDAERNLLSARLRRPRNAREPWRLRVHGWGPPGPNGLPTDKDVDLLYFYGAMDHGFSPDPGCFQVWGVDENGSVYRVVEVYRAQMGIKWWAKVIKKLHDQFHLAAVVADHDPRSKAYLNRFLSARGVDGMPLVRNAMKGNKAALIALGEWAWMQDPTHGRAHAYLVRDALQFGSCPHRAEANAPLCFEAELEDYTLKRTPDGVWLPVPDPRCADHACDAYMYGLNFAFGLEVLDRPNIGSAPTGLARVPQAAGISPLSGIDWTG